MGASIVQVMETLSLAQRRLLGDWRQHLESRRLLFDALLAAGLTVVTVAGSSTVSASHLATRQPVDGLGYALAVTATVMLLVRRLWLLPTFAVIVAATTSYIALSYVYGPILFSVVIAFYTLASLLSWQRSLMACAIGLGALLGAASVSAANEGVLRELQTSLMFAGWFLVPWCVGVAVRVRSESLRQVNAERMRRRLSEERLSIAREIHDVVGHGLAVIIMQSGVALHLMERRPEQAKTALEAIHQSGKDSLAELRATLSLFRNTAGGSPPSGPSLRRLGNLISSMSESGLSIELNLDGDLDHLSEVTDLAAYRIIQESLTNVLRHAGAGSTARLRIEQQEDQLVIEVEDDGDGTLSSYTNGESAGGFGISGMRERCETLGGAFTAGPRPEGGFLVCARFPVKDDNQ
jgi:signal transduction histidine kinase